MFYSLYVHMCIKCPTEYLELYMDYKGWSNINIKMYNNIVCADYINPISLVQILKQISCLKN